jgi:hypothetical protein
MEVLGAPFFGATGTGILGDGTKREVASPRDAVKSRGTSVRRGLNSPLG